MSLLHSLIKRGVASLTAPEYSKIPPTTVLRFHISSGKIILNFKDVCVCFRHRREDLWGAERGTGQTLLDARLFMAFMPKGGTTGLDGVHFLLGGSGNIKSWRSAWRLSLREVLSLTDQQRELQWREELLFSAGRRRAADTLKSHAAHNLLPCMRAAVLGGKQTELLNTLDSGEEKTDFDSHP